ncbi:MAG: hypothetical protein IJX34_04305 [Clostridia bacterium]|nr:hypothetical protein [Clostridia bacterium]
MKKIIWVFGESATGKKTFIEKVINNSLEISDDLGLSNKRVDVVKETMGDKAPSNDMLFNEKRRYKILLEDIKSFLENDNYDVLLLKGQCNDMNDKFGNTLKEVAMLYPQINKEIYFLEVSDLDLLYNRITNKIWFKANPEENSKKFPREWLDDGVKRHKEKVYSYMKFGYKITDIDSTNGYKISKKNEK